MTSNTPNESQRAPAILIVEDSPTQAHHFASLLRDAHFDVTIATDAAKAWKDIEESTFELVLTDIHMPGESGFALCRRIKGDRRHKDIFVALLTAYTDSENLLRGMSAGADYFFPKDNEEFLVEQIHRFLRRRQGLQKGGDEEPEKRAVATPPSSSDHRLANILGTALEELNQLGQQLSQYRSSADSRLEGVLNTIPVGVVVTRRDGTIRHFNRAAHNLLGDATDLRVEDWPQALHLSHPDETPLTLSELPTVQTMEDGNARLEVELRIQGGHTTPIPVLVNTQPVFDSEEVLSEVITTFTAITEKKRVDTIRENLIHLDRLAAIGQLASGIAHEINNPAAFITANLSITRQHHLVRLRALVDGINQIADDEDDPIRQKKLRSLLQENDCFELFADLEDTIDENLEGMARIKNVVQELADFTRSSSSAPAVTTDLNEAVRTALKMVQKERLQGVRYQSQLPSEPLWIRAHPIRLVQAVLKLLLHGAHSFAEDETDSTVVVDIFADDEFATISIGTPSLNLTEEEKLSLFSPDRKSSLDPGSASFGLAICADLVHSFDGVIQLGEEEPGLTIEVIFPLVREPDDDDSAEETPALSPSSTLQEISVPDFEGT